MKIVIADPFARMDGQTGQTTPLSPSSTSPAREPQLEKKWFMERRDQLRSSRPPPPFFITGAPSGIPLDDPIADGWFR